jgi:hypothetical protein
VLAATLAVAGPAPPRVFAQPATWADAYVTPPPEDRILPQPKTIEWTTTAFAITADVEIVVARDLDPEDLFAVRELNEELAAWGRPPLIVRPAGPDTGRRSILIGEIKQAAVAAALTAAGVRVTAQHPGEEGYVLIVGADRIVAAGADRRGTFYAVQTLRQLVRSDGPHLIARGAVIKDWPDHRLRALHVVVDNASDVVHTALVDRILSRYKLNMLVLESQYVRWDSTRAIWHPQGATKAQLAAVIAAAREHLIEPVPLIQTLGHAEWLFYNNQNLDLLEMPPDLATVRYAYDPLNPRVYDVVLPILDEAIALFRPRLLHIGHDEVRNVVPFPFSDEGRRLGFGELFVRDIERLHRHLAAAGVKTMMWGDVLLTSDYTPELARLPRDIIMVDWQYQDAARYASLDRFKAWGFPVMGATWFDLDNNASLARDGRRTGVAGMLRTTWTGYFGNRTAMQTSYDQIFSYLVAADHFWSSERAAPSLDEVEAAARFRADWRLERRRVDMIGGRSLDLRSAANRGHVDDGSGWLGKGSDYDLRNLPTGSQRFGGVRFVVLEPAQRNRTAVMLRGGRPPLHELPERVTVGVGQTAGALCFLHTLPRAAGRFGEQVATYRVQFGGGDVVSIPIRNRIEIGSWLDGPTSIDHEIVWTGRMRSGLRVNVSMFCWNNPDPSRPIVSLDLLSTGAEAAPAVFAITALDRPRATAGR